MSRPAQPLRFLALVLGAWVLARAAILVPQWSAEPAIAVVGADAVPRRAARSLPLEPAERVNQAAVTTFATPLEAPARSARAAMPTLFPAPPVARSTVEFASAAMVAGSSAIPKAIPTHSITREALASQPLLPVSNPTQLPAARANRLSLSAWALLRRGSARQLAPGGLLGGSQIGARLIYKVEDRLGVSARAYAPIDRPSGAEVALGLEWQPVRSLPVRILAERRQAVGRDGRSAFSLLAHGGVSEAGLVGPLRLDAYAQAGVVGLRSGDLFADGSARVGLPITSRLLIGAAAWGAAQPGAARLDLGPEASYRLPGTPIRVSAGYRFRVAGDARPGSGPTLTLAGDF